LQPASCRPPNPPHGEEAVEDDLRLAVRLGKGAAGGLLLAAGGGLFAGGEEVGHQAAGVGPVAAERLHDDRLDEGLDVLAAGVVGAELGALVGVEAALEEGAEDRGVDGAPVEARGGEEAADLVLGEREDALGGEEVAVEAADDVGAEVAAAGHGGEELGDLAAEALGVVAGIVDEAAEELVREQADVLGKHAEDEAVEEVGDSLGREGAVAQRLGDLADVARGVLGDGLAGDSRLELVGFEEDGAEDLEAARGAEVVELDGVDALRGVGEVGVDDDAVHVADDEERRVAGAPRSLLLPHRTASTHPPAALGARHTARVMPPTPRPHGVEVLAVEEELGVRLVEVAVLALVLPAEEVLFPDVGPAVIAAELLGAALEGEVGAIGIGGGWLVVADQLAQVEEMLLRRRPLRKLRPPPLRNELRGVHWWIL